MDKDQVDRAEKEVWVKPVLSVYGDVEELTLQHQVKTKQPGSSDDFCDGVSNFP